MIPTIAMAVPGIGTPGVWANESPTGTARVEPTLVSADFFGPTIDTRSPLMTINGKTYKTYIQGTQTGHWSSNTQLVDGIWTITWVWVPNPPGITNANVYCYITSPPDGLYSVTLSVKDLTGVISKDSWTFSVEAPPAFGTPQPNDASIVTTRYPTVSIPVKDSGGVATWSARFNGTPVTASFDGARVALSNFTTVVGTNTVAVTAADPHANSATKTWRFRVKVPSNCPCHGTSYATNPLMGPDCESCHSGSFTPKHGLNPYDFLHIPPSTAALCSGCHYSELSKEHARMGFDCMACHQSVDPKVRLAISVGSSECSGCHGSIDHYASINHTASPSPAIIRISGVDFGPLACSDCHSLALRDSHKTADGNANCPSCHPQPRNSFTNWDRSCAQGGCHTFSSANPMHNSVDASHVIPSQRQVDCIGSGCHDLNAPTVFQGKSIADIHSNATTTTASGVVLSRCVVCHAKGRTLTADCLTCHPDRALFHGYIAAKHLSTETCLGTCHSSELLPAHNAEVSATVTECSGCHPTAVAAVKPWDKACTSCHTLLTPATHPTRNKSHVGTDTSMWAYSATHYAVSHYVPGQSIYAHGCGPNASLGQVTCHDLANLAVLHQNQPKKGCTICHTPSGTKVGAAECLTCHPIGTTATPVNEDLTQRTVTLTPASDFGGSAIVTRVGGTGTNASTQLTNDGATSQLQFTTLGRTTFGFTTTPALPSNAVISKVRISSYAKSAAAGTSKLGVTVNVGGVEYDKNTVSGTLNSASYNLIYAEYTTNPARGTGAWTVADLTDPNSTYGLKAIGVNQNTAPTPNIMVTQTFATIYYTTRDVLPTPPVGSGMYHHYGTWNLNEPSVDATPGQLWYQGAASGGYYEALYRQKCYDLCHVGSENAKNMGPVLRTFTAKTGSWMWYSVAGDYNDSPAVRTLTSKTMTLPAGPASLTFDTRYILLDGDAACVQISKNGGGFLPLIGNIGGVFTSSFSGTSTGWVPATYDLSSYAGSRVKLRFTYVNSPTSYAEGWAFDNLVITGGGRTLLQDDAESANDNWTNYHWTRAHGAIETYWAY